MKEKQTAKNIFLDGLVKKEKPPLFRDLPLARYVVKYKRASVLFSRRKRTDYFFTRDSKLYLTPEELRLSRRGARILRIEKRLDSLHFRSFEKSRIYSVDQSDTLYVGLRRRYSGASNYLLDLFSGAARGVSPVKMWNLSIIGAVFFGMFTMTMIYQYLGQGVSAKIQEAQGNEPKKTAAEAKLELPVEGDALEAGEESASINGEINLDFITELIGGTEKEKEKYLEEEIRGIVKGYPIEKMATEIAKKDRMVAAFLIAIAKKESNWGKRVPVRGGQDCYNYWGYRGIREKMGSGGHTCFDSPRDAVDTVAKRLEMLVEREKLNTPEKMVVWKCGYDCSWDSKTAVRKWISDVDLYFQKLNKEG